MILDFSPENLRDWEPFGRCQTLKLNGCLITLSVNKAVKRPIGECFLKKSTRTGKIQIFGPFNYVGDRMWKLKALIAALQGDELNKKNLAKLVVMRMQNGN